MGTELHVRGIPFERRFDELNVTEPRMIEEIHRDYIRAGAELIETNTFGANRIKLARHGLEAKVRDINFRAVKLAREAREVSGEPVFPSGIGGTDRPDAGAGGPHHAGRGAGHLPRADRGPAGGGADLLVLETFTNLPELLAAVDATRAACDLPVVAQMTYAEDGLT
jgi:homocysteine S-methyltransferase